MFAVVVLLIAVAAATEAMNIRQMPVGETEHRNAFHSLMKAHDRDYEIGSTEYHARFDVFKNNVLRVRDLQQKSKKAGFALNLFFDVSEEEFKKYKMDPKDITDPQVRKDAHITQKPVGKPPVARSCLGGGAEKRSAVDEAEEARRLAALPTSFDWRKHDGILTPVKNQEQCGSCWAFSATEVLESAWRMANHSLPVLAPQQIVDCSKACSTEGNPPMVVCDQGCMGGWPWAAYDSVIIEGGQEAEASYPYTGVNGQCKFDKSKIVAVPRNFTCVSGPNDATEAQVKEALVGRPISVCVDAGSWQFYEFGIIANEGGLICNPTSLDHAVSMVAYGKMDNIIGQQEDVVIIRNSWGPSWGIQGGYVALAATENTCGYRSAVSYVEV